MILYFGGDIHLAFPICDTNFIIMSIVEITLVPVIYDVTAALNMPNVLSVVLRTESLAKSEDYPRRKLCYNYYG